MGAYIDREGSVVGLHSENVGNSTVRVRTRVIGTKVMVDAFEYGDPADKPVSKTAITRIIRTAAKPHAPVLGTPRIISDATIVRDRNRLDSNGNVDTSQMRIRSTTFVLGK